MITCDEHEGVDFKAEHEKRNHREMFVAEVLFVLLIHKKGWEMGVDEFQGKGLPINSYM